MNKENIIDFYEQLEKQDLLFSYKGEITSQIIMELIQKSEQLLKSKKVSKRIQKKVCNISIESLQNLYHHQIDFSNNTKDFQPKYKEIIFMIAFKEEAYHVMTGNYLHNENKEELKRKIDLINQIDDAHLRTNYQKKLSEGAHSEKGTAGLGFIDMRKKSGNPIKYSFHKINSTVSFFCLDFNINEN